VTPRVRLTYDGQEIPIFIVPALILLISALAWHHGRLEYWMRKSIEDDRRVRRELLDRFKPFGRRTDDADQ
jgi:hypothetical protein